MLRYATDSSRSTVAIMNLPPGEWLLPSHWRNFKALGPTLLVYVYFLVLAYINLASRRVHSHPGTSSSNSAKILGRLPPPAGASSFFLPLVNPVHPHSRLGPTGKPRSPPDFPAHETSWHRRVSLPFVFLTRFSHLALCLCAHAWLYVYVYGHIPA